MRCPFCGSEDTQVKDSRPVDDGGAIRRRRQCPACGARFTTFERVQLRELLVVKKDGRRLPFDRDKLVRSISIATRKRGIAAGVGSFAGFSPERMRHYLDLGAQFVNITTQTLLLTGARVWREKVGS